MPSRTLPTLTRAEVESHDSSASCYVTIGTKVYDVTDFMPDHPGGSDLILEYAGKDVEDILKDFASHQHSEAAYEVLDDSLVGFVAPVKAVAAKGRAVPLNGDATDSVNGSSKTGPESVPTPHPRTGMSCEEDLSKETDFSQDYKKHKFLDLGRPLFPQIWYGGFSKEFYLDQVHRPRHYRGGDSAPLFGNFLEPLSKTPWWVVPSIWLPCVAYGTYLADHGLAKSSTTASYWAFGLFLWTFVEYCLHRFLFHLDEYVTPLMPVSRGRELTRNAVIYPIIELASRRISCCTASTTIFPWTSTALSCRPRCLSCSRPPSGISPTQSSTSAGTRRRPCFAGASLATYATT